MINKLYCDGLMITERGGGVHRIVGYGFTICDYYGKVVKRKIFIEKEPSMGYILHSEFIAVIESIKMIKPGGTIVSDRQDVVQTLTNGKTNQYPPDIEIIALKTRIKMLEKGIQVIWIKRDLNMAGIYNDRFPIKKLIARCKCYEKGILLTDEKKKEVPDIKIENSIVGTM